MRATRELLRFARALSVLIVASFSSWLLFRSSSWFVPTRRDLPSEINRQAPVLGPCIGPDVARARTHTHAVTEWMNQDEIQFVTFAFTKNEGDRWDTRSARTALRLMYSSLVRSQSTIPRLHVYTDAPDVVPEETTFGAKTQIVVHACHAHSFPENPYSKIGKWAAVSRAKLDAVEDLLLQHGGRIIWIDLDTLVFVDLTKTFRQSPSWVVGYQRGVKCQGLSDCIPLASSWVRPEFDTLGDLWSLDLHTITKVRDFEKRRITSSRRRPPKYDLQTYFGLMLEENTLPHSGLLHRILHEYNFGFFCSGFRHPTSQTLKLSVDKRHLVCPLKAGVDMGQRVGTISFTAKTYTFMLLNEERAHFDAVIDRSAREWLVTWFYGEP